MLNIRVATEKDFNSVRDFYYSLIDKMKNSKYKPGWEKDVYPTRKFLNESICNKELYVVEIKGEILSCMVVNHKYNEGYNGIKWSINVEDSEMLVIHALGVSPVYAGKGIAKQMVKRVIEIAKKCEIKTIRLDVLSGNIPAEKLYVKMGFTYCGTTKMFYEDTGFVDYKLYEYIV